MDTIAYSPRPDAAVIPADLTEALLRRAPTGSLVTARYRGRGVTYRKDVLGAWLFEGADAGVARTLTDRALFRLVRDFAVDASLWSA